MPDGNVKEHHDDFVHVKNLDALLHDVGLPYLVTNKSTRLEKELVENADRDKTHGDDFISLKDVVKFVEKYIHKYTDDARLKEAIGFFDNDNDGKIGNTDLRSMMNSFGLTEQEYIHKVEKLDGNFRNVQPLNTEDILRQGTTKASLDKENKKFVIEQDLDSKKLQSELKGYWFKHSKQSANAKEEKYSNPKVLAGAEFTYKKW